MLGKIRRRKAGGVQRIPEARVVLGRHSPSWENQEWASAVASDSATTYERVSLGREGIITTILGFWPLIAIMSMGIALIWSASVSAGP